jgi:hypothetical protein
VSALISFLGGSAFRMVWGEISSFITARQEHKYELARMQAQGALDAAQAERNMAAIKLQADLGVKTIEVQSDADIGKIEVSAWKSAVDAVGAVTGIKWLDIANGTVRPLLAYLSILVVVVEIAVTGWILSDWDRELVAAILGIYVADRTLMKRGK